MTSAGADSAAFLEQEAGSIPLMLAEECGKMAATFAIAEPAKPLPSNDDNGDGDVGGNGQGFTLVHLSASPATRFIINTPSFPRTPLDGL
jgi:hypothetical protein